MAVYFCRKCLSQRIANISVKCSDMCNITIQDKEHFGYVPRDMGIGGGDYLVIALCLNCGMADGSFPIEETKIEASGTVEEY